MSDGAASEHHSPTTTSTTTTPVTSNAVATPPPSLEMRGALNKWTNYIHGWQTRWLVLAGGQLSYYKAPGETTLGCRGTIALHSAAVKLHPFDECRLDVCVAGDAAVWYLRAASAEQRACWAAAIERARLATAVAETTSVNAAVSSGAALTLGGALWLTTLNDKLAEVDAYRQLLVGQLSQLQTQLDAAVTSVDVRQNLSPVTAVGSRHQRSSSTSAVCFGGGGRTAPLSECGELRGDAVTFAATCASLVDALRQCVQLAGERDELWQRRLQREQERCAVLEQSLSRLQSTSVAAVASAATDVTKTGLEASVAGSSGSGETLRLAQFGAPDFQEGPHSTIGEDEFFDAVETALDRIHDDQELSDSLRRHHSTMTAAAAAVGGGDSAASGDASTCGGTATAGVVVQQQQPPSPSSSLPDVSLPCGEMRRRVALLDEVQRVTNEQLHYAMAGVDDGVWQLFAEDGDMKMYKREEEIDGLAVDPLKAVHTIDGVTAHEICWHFWAHQVRLEWETTVEQLTVLESLDDNTIIALQLHKRVWPATQRDSLFWSHLARRSGGDGGGGCVSIVVNHSTEHDSEPARRSAANSNLVRLKLTVCMACRTDVVLPDGTTRPLDLTDGQVGGQQVTRDQLRSHITYCAVVNPGGWAPTSALRMVYRREYPRFLKRFTRYVVEQCKHRPVQW